jgi:hypothetical protein
MFPVADAICAKVSDGEEAEWEVKGSESKVYA